MSTLTRRLAGATAIPALALGLSACGGDSGSDDSSGGGDAQAQLNAHDAVMASYEGLDSESFKMESEMTVNGLDFMVMTGTYDGESSQMSADILMSAILEASGEDFSEEPEAAEMMEQLFTDMQMEAVAVDGTMYMQMSGGMFEMLTEEYGEDAWFTMDLTEGELGAVYEEFGGMDLAAQTELMLTDLSDVEEVEDGVYTGTLSGDSEAMDKLLGATGAAGSMTGEAAEMMDDVEVTVKVDDEGVLESMEMTFPETEGMTMEFVSEIVEVGGDYSIEAPDSDNLVDFSELEGMMQQ